MNYYIEDQIQPLHYQSVIFNNTNTFIQNELILFPRNEGGFSYGYIEEQLVINKCNYSYNCTHPSFFWKIKLYSKTTIISSKILPTYKIGKFIERNEIREINQLEPKDYESVLFDEELLSESELIVCPNPTGGLQLCLKKGFVTIECKNKLYKHTIEAIRVVNQNGKEFIFPKNCCGIIMTNELKRGIVIDGANLALTQNNNILILISLKK